MPTVEQMRIVMDADTARMVNGMRAADRYLAQFVQNAERRLNRLDAFTRNAGMAFASIGAGLGASQILDYANAWTRVGRTIEASGEAFGITLKSASELTDLANDARIDVEAFTKTYVRAAAAIRDYGYDSETAARLTSTLSKALKLGSANTGEQASVLLQFSQALQKGKLDGDEFRSIMENAGIVQELLAQRLNVTKGEIIKLAAAGKLQIPDLVGAMVDGGEQIDRIFNKMPQTVDESLTVLRNAFTQYIGDVDRAANGTSKLSGAIGALARNIEPVADTALSIGAGLLAAFSGPAVRGLATFAGGAATALPPLRMIALMIGTAGAAINLFGDDIAASADGMVTLSDTVQAFINVASGELAPVAAMVSDAWAVAVQMITDALAGMPVSLSDMVAAAKWAVNSVIGLFAAADKIITATFTRLPYAVAEEVIKAINFVIEKFEGMLKTLADGLNSIPGIKAEAPNLDRIDNAFEGSSRKWREAGSEAAALLSKDYVGAIGGAISAAGAKVDAERRRIAELRRWSEGTSSNPHRDGKRATPSIDEGLAREAEQAAERIAQLQIQALEASGAHRMAVQLEYDRDVAGFQRMLDQKLISQTQFDQARAALAEMAARDMIEATEREMPYIADVTQSMLRSTETAFDQFVETGKASFSDFAASVLNDISRIVLRMTVLEPLFGGGATGGSGMIGSALASIFGGFRADGGPVSRNKAYVVGERGPELFLPRASGRIVPNEALSAPSSGGMPPVTITINAPNATPDAVRQLEARIPGMVLTGVREAMNRRLA